MTVLSWSWMTQIVKWIKVFGWQGYEYYFILLVQVQVSVFEEWISASAVLLITPYMYVAQYVHDQTVSSLQVTLGLLPAIQHHLLLSHPLRLHLAYYHQYNITFYCLIPSGYTWPTTSNRTSPSTARVKLGIHNGGRGKTNVLLLVLILSTDSY